MAIGLQLWCVVVVPCFILGLRLVRVAKFCFAVCCWGKYLFCVVAVWQSLCLCGCRGCLPVLFFYRANLGRFCALVGLMFGVVCRLCSYIAVWVLIKYVATNGKYAVYL